MKTLQQLCQTPLYISAKVSIKPTWENLIEFANTSKNIDFEQNFIENDVNEFFFYEFEKILEEENKNTFIHNFLDVEHIVRNNNKSLTIAPNEGFQLLRLFQDMYCKEYNFPTLFFGHSRPPLKCSYQKIPQEKIDYCK